MKLHLGCGRTRLPEYVNVDVVAGPAVDLVLDFDACGPGGARFPYPDDAVEESYASHVIEHLPDLREREAELLGPQNETDALAVAPAVRTHAPLAARRDQSTTLVESQRPHGDIPPVREFSPR